jgi:hypothetical protein
MRDVTKQAQRAIEVAGARFAPGCETGRTAAGAYLTVNRKRVAVHIATLRCRGAADATIRLRFDKVATRLIERLQAAVAGPVPQGTTVLVTITAPIRLAAKTAAALEERIRTLLARGLSDRDRMETLYGNRVRIRLWRHDAARRPKLIGFVHNPDVDAVLLLNIVRELHDRVRAAAGAGAAIGSGDRWLVVISAAAGSAVEAYRYMYSQLRLTTPFRKVVIVFGDERVEMLAD